MLRLYLSSPSPWNSTYSDSDGHLLFKVESPPISGPRRITIYRALPDATLPTSERQLWEERHFFETHPSGQLGHSELDGQGSGFGQDGLIMEESRGVPGLGSSDEGDSLYEYPLRADIPERRSAASSSSSARIMHAASHPFWVKESWVHFADVDYCGERDTRFNVAGKEFVADEFFDKDGWLKRGLSFTAWDGFRYRWDLNERSVKLYRSTDRPPQSQPRQDLVAEFIPSTTQRKTKAHPPMLVVHPPGEAIVDLVLVTFIFGMVYGKEGSGTDISSGIRVSTLSLRARTASVSPKASLALVAPNASSRLV